MRQKELFSNTSIQTAFSIEIYSIEISVYALLSLIDIGNQLYHCKHYPDDLINKKNCKNASVAHTFFLLKSKFICEL